MFSTSCRNCVFAVYEAEDGVPTQTGCVAGRLEVLRTRPGVTVEPVQDPPGRADRKAYFAVDGTGCLFRRTPPWAGTPEDVRREARPRFRVFVDLSGTPEDAMTTLTALADCTPRPDRVTLVSRADGHPVNPLINWLRQHSPFAYDHVRSANDFPAVVDESLRDCPSTFYVTCRAGHTFGRDDQHPQPDLFARLRGALVDREERFVLAEGNGLTVVQTFAHRAYNGNAPAEVSQPYGGGKADGIGAKLRLVAVQSGLTDLVKPLAEVVGA